jgi:hypothetical protein
MLKLLTAFAVAAASLASVAGFSRNADLHLKNGRYHDIDRHAVQDRASEHFKPAHVANQTTARILARDEAKQPSCQAPDWVPNASARNSVEARPDAANKMRDVEAIRTRLSSSVVQNSAGRQADIG